MNTYCVYMVMCIDGTYYVGITNDVDRRVAEHNLGVDEGAYTHSRRPVVAVHVSEFSEVLQAIACEKKLKGWSHAKKSALARGDWQMIQALSKSKNYRPPSERMPRRVRATRRPSPTLRQAQDFGSG